jgi:hypothetical protein
MSKVKKNIYDVLRGGFLINESSFKNWRMIFFIVVLLLIMISSAHSSDKKVLEISELNKLKRELRAIYIDTQTTLMRMKMESNIRQRAKMMGLQPSKTPPKRIKVFNKE